MMPSAVPRKIASVTPVARRRKHANKSPNTFFRRHAGQFAQHAGIVSLVVGILRSAVRFIGGIARRMNSRRAA